MLTVSTGSPTFVMKPSVRHPKVQLPADQYCSMISLRSRSFRPAQASGDLRRNPCAIAKQETFEDMKRAAVRLAKFVGYVSGGTVERKSFDDLRPDPRTTWVGPIVVHISRRRSRRSIISPRLNGPFAEVEY